MKRSFDEEPSSPSDRPHEYMYKLRGITCEELRKRRRLKEIQIRKEKRNALLDIRRHLRTEINEYVANDHLIDKSALDMMMSGSYDQELAAVKFLREKIYKIGEPCLYRLAATSLIPLLVELYLRDNEELKREVAWILINMNNGRNSFKCELKNTVLSSLCSLVKEQHDDLVLAQLLWCLASLIEDSVAGRNFAIENQIVQQIKRICEGHTDIEVLRHSVWLISQLFLRITEYTPDITMLFPLLPLVFAALSSEDGGTQCDAIRACTSMSECFELIEPMYLAGIHLRLIDLIPIISSVMRPSVIRIMANIIQDTSCYTEALVNHGLLEHLIPMIGVRTIARDVCFIIANISAEGEKMIDLIVNSNIMPEITRLLESSDYETRKEACYIVCNVAMSRNMKHLSKVLDAQLLRPLCDFLTVMDLEIVGDVMDAIANLLEFGEQMAVERGEFDNGVAVRLEEIGGKDKLEFLTNSDSIDIHIKAYEVLDRFFYGKDDNLYEMDDNVASRHAGFSGKMCSSSKQEERDSVDDIIDNVLRDG